MQKSCTGRSINRILRHLQRKLSDGFVRNVPVHLLRLCGQMPPASDRGLQPLERIQRGGGAGPLMHISRIEKFEIVLTNNVELPISQSRYMETKAGYVTFLENE